MDMITKKRSSSLKLRTLASQAILERKRHPFRSIVKDDIKNCNHYAFLHILTLFIGFFTWFWIRLIGLIISFICFIFWINILSIGVKFGIPGKESIDKKPTVSSFRRKLVHVITKFWVRLMLFCLGIFWIKVDGKKNWDGRARIIGGAPHGTCLDGQIIMMVMDKPFTGIAAANEGKRPLVGTFYKILDYLFIDYNNPDSRRNCAKSLIHRAKSDDWKDHKILLMCEGTTNNGTHITQCKKGAFMAGQPVQPIVLEFPEWIDIFKCNLDEERVEQRGAGWASWGHDIGILNLFLYLLAVPWQPVIVKILPAYFPNEEEQNDALLFSHNVRNKMEEQSKYTIMKCNRFDGVVCKEAKLKGIDPVDNFIIYGEELEEEFGTKVVKDKIILELLEKFFKAGEGDAYSEIYKKI